jgi:hypothetical protein
MIPLKLSITDPRKGQSSTKAARFVRIEPAPCAEGGRGWQTRPLLQVNETPRKHGAARLREQQGGTLVTRLLRYLRPSPVRAALSVREAEAARARRMHEIRNLLAEIAERPAAEARRECREPCRA